MLVRCPSSVVDVTLVQLREAGNRDHECVVLWLGHCVDRSIQIEKAYRPLQRAQVDMFHIPPEGMNALHSELRRHRYMVAAQVHSHPGPAYHSGADDHWAIIRREGSLSLVVPSFARGTSVADFLDNTKVYRFSTAAEWVEIPQIELDRSCLRIY